MTNPKAWVYHTMRDSWRNLYKQVSWWAKTQPRLSKKELFKQVTWHIILSIKQFPLIIAHLNDPVGIFVPPYVALWNTWYFMYSLS